jgi:hypothetical protein
VDLLDLMDALQVHALAAANAVGGPDFHDVEVGFPAAQGRSVRIFYGGERESVYLGEGSLNSEHIAQAVVVRGYWPLPETAAQRHRAMEGEMARFVKQFRTRVNADFQLGGGSTAIKIQPAQADQVLIAGNKYAAVELEVLVDFDDYLQSP